MNSTAATYVGTGEHLYEWVDHWVRIPDGPSGRENGRTHGVVYSAKRDRFVVFNQADPAVLIITPDGRIESSWGDRFAGAHGLTLICEGDEEYLWLTDEFSCEVVKTTLDGEPIMRIERPELPVYQEGPYSPTWAAQHPVNGEVWVADGYGSSLVHRYDADGIYVQTIDGTEGAGRLREPHGLQFSSGAAGVELFITDRVNQRIVVYDDEGVFLRSASGLHSPCSFDFHDGLVVVPELFTGVKLLCRESLELVQSLGDNPAIRPRTDGRWYPPSCPEGWPDLAGTDAVQAGVFNSPHGACFGPDGSIYVVEWIVGGRITKLAKR